jgi:HD-GYP domain-containing protein (c-di-GMP phosphodiesterase class II)
LGHRRIIVGELAVGTVLAWDAYDEQGRLLLKKGQTIASASQVEGLIERGLYTADEPVRERPRPPEPAVPTTGSAVALILDARQRLQLACSPNGSKERFAEHILAIRALIREACLIGKDAALAMTLLHRVGRYSIRHSVDTAIAVEVVGGASGCAEPELSSAVSAALTMNVSMLQLQDDLQAQEEPLTDAQRELIKKHPDAGAAFLRTCGVDDEVWVKAVQCHHEAIDGSGYSGTSGDEIPLAAQLVSLADIYCARISSRDYRAPLRPNQALRALFLDQSKKVQDGLAHQFIKAIGIFPSGTPVRLNNGEIAVVTGSGENVKAPHVCAIIGADGMPLRTPMRRDTSQAPCGVREVVSWSELGAPPSMQAIFGKVAAVN